MWTVLFGWMPPALAIVCLIYLLCLSIYIVLRLVSIVLDAIPFL